MGGSIADRPELSSAESWGSGPRTGRDSRPAADGGGGGGNLVVAEDVEEDIVLELVGCVGALLAHGALVVPCCNDGGGPPLADAFSKDIPLGMWSLIGWLEVWIDVVGGAAAGS